MAWFDFLGTIYCFLKLCFSDESKERHTLNWCRGRWVDVSRDAGRTPPRLPVEFSFPSFALHSFSFVGQSSTTTVAVLIVLVSVKANEYYTQGSNDIHTVDPRTLEGFLCLVCPSMGTRPQCGKRKMEQTSVVFPFEIRSLRFFTFIFLRFYIFCTSFSMLVVIAGCRVYRRVWFFSLLALSL